VANRSWVLLAYRLPREPSTPRIALWRKLKLLGVAQLMDGLVALPLDNRNREQLEWLAQEVSEAGGDATIWLADPASKADHQALAKQLAEAVAADYRQLVDEAQAARDEDPRTRRRVLARLRRELQRLRRRDYFSPPEREGAVRALQELGSTLEAEAEATQ
jgi:hypothetical protein